MSEMPYVFLPDLAQLFNYSSVKTARDAIKRGTFPVHTYKLAGQWVADREVVREYFRRQREAGLSALR